MFSKSSSRSSGSFSSRPTNILCTCLLSLIASSYLTAKERTFRVFDQSNGLPVASLSGFAQDANGFFWLGTAAGIFRFDGTEFRPWARGKLAGWYYGVYPSPDGEVFVFDLTHTLYHILPNEDAEPVSGPDGNPFTNVRDVAFTRAGRFWVARPDALFYRDERSQWQALPREIPGNEKIWKLSTGLDDSLWVATTHGIWKVNSDLGFQRILTSNFDGYIGNVIAHPDGSFFFMEKYATGGKIFQWQHGKVSERISLNDNLHDFVLRGETIWANGDRHMVAFRPNREPEVLKDGQDAPIGGSMTVDHEGSLWMTNGKELFQLPEPDTDVWTSHDGLPDLSTIALHETAEGIWLSTWSGLGHLERGANWRAHDDQLTHKGEMCSDGQGSLWLHDYHDFWQRWRGKFIKYPQPASGAAEGCDRARDGSVWMSTSHGLWRLQSGQAPMLVSHPPGNDEPGKVFADSQGRLWFTREENACYTPVAGLQAGAQVQWSCETIKGARVIGKPVELADGSLWVGTDMLGVWRRADAGWQSIPASLQSVSKSIGRLVSSPSGGVWVLGTTARMRVLPRPDLSDGWQVVEQLSNLQGLPAGGIGDLIEEPDKSLWIATANGVAHLPGSARYPKLEPPRVNLVNLFVNGAPVDLTVAPRIPAGRNQVEVRFAALSYRDRSLLRYQYKLHPGDAWSEANGSVPAFRFYDLRAGSYAVEIRASLDGVSWSTRPARISFEVLSPWYFRWWAIALFALLTASVLFAAHRVRVRVLLQWEQQRTRIAMDLHDEIGSGLGSIGILSSVAASPTVGADERQEMTRRIAETADELGASLTDIVWSLRSDTSTLESLAYHLTRRAGSFFANDRTQFTTDFPDDWRAINLSLTTRRNILLIAMESLHNAAKHAQAENVTLQFRPADARKWLMRIEDDGCGLPSDAAGNGSGMGMQSMKKRAAEIGAEINFTSKNGRGTIVSLIFNPQARERV